MNQYNITIVRDILHSYLASFDAGLIFMVVVSRNIRNGLNLVH